MFDFKKHTAKKMNQNVNKLIDDNKCQVLLLTSKAHFPLNFALHSWFVVNDFGQVSRFEVLYFNEGKSHLYKDKYEPFQGLGFTPFQTKHSHVGKLLGTAEDTSGSLAKKMADFIEGSMRRYPYRQKYSILGPNSNTYIQWVLNAFPDFEAKLPWNAFGKNYKGD